MRTDHTTILWYDLETFGTNSQYDRVAQFAAIRTDMELNTIEDPIVLYCKLSEDYLPDPLACLVTGITPQEVNEKGIPEHLFIKKILRELSLPGTCTSGYNCIKFDDEFIRNLLYRNFLDPYEREYKNGNTRWDLIDVVRATHDLRPNGIQWIKNDDGKPSFRLENLTAANEIEHEGAHDALVDVHATIGLAKLLKEKQPRLYDYAFNMRIKKNLKDLIDFQNLQPVLHTSAVHTTQYGCTAVILPITVDPRNANSIICFDLSKDPEALIAASQDDLPSPDVPLTTVALNRSPFIAPLKTLTPEAAERLHIDLELCRRNQQRLMERHDLTIKLRLAFSSWKSNNPADPDFQIYSGGFFSDSDKERFQIIQNTPKEELLDLRLNFQDPRIPEMLWRYIARNYPEILDDEHKKRWKSFAASRILFPPGDVMIDLQFFRRKIKEKSEDQNTSAADKIILRKLADYGNFLENRLFR